MKRYLFPLGVIVYFLITLAMTRLEFKAYELSNILSGIGKIPEEIVKSLLLILGLGIVSVAIYLFTKEKGGSKE